MDLENFPFITKRMGVEDLILNTMAAFCERFKLRFDVDHDNEQQAIELLDKIFDAYISAGAISDKICPIVCGVEWDNAIEEQYYEISWRNESVVYGLDISINGELITKFEYDSDE